MIIYFDTETTGLAPGNICQLSYIIDDGEKVTPKNYFFEVDFVSRGAQLVHGFTREKLQVLSNGRRFYAFCGEILSDFEKADLIIAHNLPFDLSFMRKEAEDLNCIFKYKQGLCSMRYFTPILKLARKGGRGLKYPTLKELGEYFEIYPYDVSINMLNLYKAHAGAHDARYDTTLLYLIFKKAFANNLHIKSLVLGSNINQC